MNFYIAIFIILIIYIFFNNVESFTTKNDDEKDSISYDLKNIFTTRYHEKADDIIKRNPFLNKVYYFNNETQQIEHIPRTEYKSYTTYNPPNTFKYGPETYVPSYTDSVHLSLNTPKPKENQIYKKWSGNRINEAYVTDIDIIKKLFDIMHYGYDNLQNTLDTFLINLKNNY